MTHSQEPESAPNRRRGRPWRWVGLAVGSVLIVGSIGAAWRGWIYAQNNLPQWISEALSEALQRPVDIGDLEAIGPGGMRFGPSAIPPTATDPDTLTLAAIDIRFNLLELLGRQLNLSLDLEDIDGYVEQSADADWLDLEIQPPEEQDRPQERLIGTRVAGITLKLQTIRIVDGRLTAVPYPPEGSEPITVAYKDVQSRVEFNDATVADAAEEALVVKTQQIDFIARGTSVEDGALEFKGSVLLPPLTGENETGQGPANSQGKNFTQPSRPTRAIPLLPWIADHWQEMGRHLLPGSRVVRASQGGADFTTQVKLNIRAQETRVADVMPIVESLLQDPLPVQFPTGLVSGTADFTRNGQAPWSLQGMARVREGTVVTAGLPEPVTELDGDVRFRGQIFEFEGVTARLGELTAEAGGTVDLQSGYDLAGQFDPFTLAQVSDLFEGAVPLDVDGTFGADVTMTGALNNPILATELVAQDTVMVDQVPFSTMTATAVLAAPQLQIQTLRLVPQAGGTITGSGTVTFGQPATLALSLTGDSLPANALGRPYGLPDTPPLGPVFVEANVSGPVTDLIATASWRAPSGDFPARGDLRYANNRLQFSDTFVQVAGGSISGDGVLANRQWSADLKARGVQLSQLAAGVTGELTADGRLTGSLDSPGLAGMQGQGTATAALPAGTVTTQASLSGGRWTADVQGSNLQLAAFSPALQGTGTGNFNLSGTTADFSLAGIQGQGQVVLSDGLATAASLSPQLALVREPLTADLGWNGQVIQIQQANTAGIQVDGTVTPQLQEGFGIANLDLTLHVDSYNLAALPLPDVVPVGGAASFDGRLTGSPKDLNLMGNASLSGLTLSQLAFASPLTGPVLYSTGGGLNVDLQGGRDRIQVAANQGENDLDFLVTSGDAFVEGYRRADNLYARIDNLPLAGLKLPPGGLDGVGTVSGTIDSAVIEANLRESRFRTTFDIVDPGLGYISLQTADGAAAAATGTMADNGIGPAPEESAPEESPLTPAPMLETRYGRLRGTVTFADDILTLVGVNIESASGSSNYMASGTVTLGQPSAINATLEVDNGNIQDLLLTLKIFELSDLRLNLLQPPNWFRPITAADIAALETTQVGDPDASLLEQIRRLAEVIERQNILLAQQEAAPLPPLDELRGAFSGRITASGAITPEDLLVTVDLTGEDWVWGTVAQNGPAYQIDELIAQGSYQNQVITLNPVLLQSNSAGVNAEADEVARLRLNGEFSLDRDDPVARTLELELANMPLDTVRRPLRLPANLDGELNIGATLTGSLDNPQIRGRLQVADAIINREDITQASANFLYKDARLNVIGNLAVADNEEAPLNLIASVPYQLPMATRPPDTNELRVNLAMQDEGFALINLFTQTVTWESGEASLNLTLRGTVPQNGDWQAALTSLSVGGGASLQGVTVSSTLLPEPLTNIQGDIQVINDRGTGLASSIYRRGLVLAFNHVRGDFSDGEVVARGNLKVIPSINDVLPGYIDESQPLAPLPAESDAARPVGSEPTVGAEPADQPTTPAAGATGTAPRPDDPTATVDPSPAGETPVANRDSPLRINLDNINLALKGLYNGAVDGDVIVDGAVFLLQPLISGDVRLSNGAISLPETENGQTMMPLPGSGSPNGDIFSPSPPTFDNFDLILGENVRVAIAGVIDVKAEGELDLVGTLPDVRPVGRINLPSGRVNLLTTAFRLTGNENYAEFRPGDEKIDPFLVATLSTAVTDTASGTSEALSLAPPFPRNEVSDAELNQLGLTQGGVETIRIRAQVDGRISRVTQLQGVELSSTPPRSDGAIVALISGGVLNALESTIGSVAGSGDSFQGLIALAGSALLNNIQEILGDSLNVSELRLFSATPQSAQNTGELDIGGEIGVNLSPNISVSVQKVFTNITPAIFNVRYRINDNLTLRGVTSYEQFSENTGAILEIQF